MDYTIFHAINGLAGRSHLLDQIGIFFAEYFLYVLVVLVAALWFNKSLRSRVYLAAVNSVVARLVIVEIIKRIADRPRPYEVIQVNKLIIDNERGNSFPSGHTVFFFAIAFSFYGTKWFWPLVILAAIGSVARVFVGVHYPADVVVSVILAAVTVPIFFYLFRKQKLL
ncbi:MAG: phosphatase PAP2 family protein [Candidatus Saccharibacteria bacterium]